MKNNKRPQDTTGSIFASENPFAVLANRAENSEKSDKKIQSAKKPEEKSNLESNPEMFRRKVKSSDKKTAQTRDNIDENTYQYLSAFIEIDPAIDRNSALGKDRIRCAVNTLLNSDSEYLSMLLEDMEEFGVNLEKNSKFTEKSGTKIVGEYSPGVFYNYYGAVYPNATEIRIRDFSQAADLDFGVSNSMQYVIRDQSGTIVGTFGVQTIGTRNDTSAYVEQDEELNFAIVPRNAKVIFEQKFDRLNILASSGTNTNITVSDGQPLSVGALLEGQGNPLYTDANITVTGNPQIIQMGIYRGISCQRDVGSSGNCTVTIDGKKSFPKITDTVFNRNTTYQQFAESDELNCTEPTRQNLPHDISTITAGTLPLRQTNLSALTAGTVSAIAGATALASTELTKTTAYENSSATISPADLTLSILASATIVGGLLYGGYRYFSNREKHLADAERAAEGTEMLSEAERGQARPSSSPQNASALAKASKAVGCVVQ